MLNPAGSRKLFSPQKTNMFPEKSTMNEDVFPIKKGGFSNVMLILRGVYSPHYLRGVCKTSHFRAFGFGNHQPYGTGKIEVISPPFFL